MATINYERDYRADNARAVDVVTTEVKPAVQRRVSWGAILAGVAVSLVSMIGLNMLGLAIGAGTINPSTQSNPIASELGTSAAVWILGANILSLFFGGLVAGRLSGFSDNLDGMLNGLVQWAVAFLITVVLLTTSIGNLVGAATGAVSSGISAIGQGLTAISPAVAEAVDLEATSLQGVGVEVTALLRRAASAAGVETTTDAEGNEVASGTLAAETGPTLNEIEVTRAVVGFLANMDPTDEERQSVITLLTERTGISQVEATDTVNRWETTITRFRTEAEATAREVGQQAADTISALAGVVFASMLVAAFASAAGGIIGSPDPREVVTSVRRDVTNTTTN